MKKVVFVKTVAGENVLDSPNTSYLCTVTGRGEFMDCYWTKDLNEAALFYEDDTLLKEVRKRCRNSKRGESPVFTFRVREAKIVLVD